MSGLKKIGEVINERQLHRLVPKADNPENTDELTVGKPPSFRLFVTFYAGPRKKYSWTGQWLFDTLRKEKNLNISTQWEAIKYKMDLLRDRCSLMRVYDNRPGAPYPQVYEEIKGHVTIDNVKIAKKFK